MPPGDHAPHQSNLSYLCDRSEDQQTQMKVGFVHGTNYLIDL
jgi:hypothetical protein